MRQILIIFCLLLSACNFSISNNNDPLNSPLNTTSTWHLQLQGKLDTQLAVDLYDVDLFDTPKRTISQLKERGITVICYFSAGSFEDWREDADDFSPQDIGNSLDGWEGESWLDIRSAQVKSIMQQRILLAAEKDCDGIDPDNVDGYQNLTGFNLTNEDQLTFNRFLATTAHRNGLIIGLKNDLEQITELEPLFDFAVNEQCQAFDECEYLTPFARNNKLIINIEYDSNYASKQGKKRLCNTARQYSMQSKLMPLELNGDAKVSCF